MSALLALSTCLPPQRRSTRCLWTSIRSVRPPIALPPSRSRCRGPRADACRGCAAQHFGGQGSFFASWPTRGSFEVNPPFDKESVAAAYSHINAVLTKAATATGGLDSGGDGGGGGFSYTPAQQALWAASADEAVVQSLFEMGAGAWSKVGCMRAAVAASNDVQVAIDWCMEHTAEIAPVAAEDTAARDDDVLLYVVVAPRSIDLKQDIGFNPAFILGKLHLDPHHHVFTRGFQHRNHEYWVCPNSTWVTFLGNQAAKVRWNGIEQGALEKLADSFRLERQ